MSVRRTLIIVAALAVSSASAFADNDPTRGRPEHMLESVPAATTRSDDPVLASFRRMLTHEPNRVAPPVLANFESDPLIAALALPVLRWLAETRRQTAEAK